MKRAIVWLMFMRLAAAAFAAPPNLAPGVWTNVTPPAAGIPGSGNMATFVQGMAIDPSNPDVLYVTVSGFNNATFATIPGGLFKSADRGGTWTEIGSFDQPINVRVNPDDPLHIYVGDGVRGGTNGFWVTRDGGATWTMPQGFRTAAQSVQVFDVYHVEPDPADFNHVLVTFHYYWNNCAGGVCNAGIFESFDGGDSWNIIQPDPGWANTGGYDVFFLYNPALGIGNAQTWLLGTQGNGYWRTTNGGQSWTKVSDVDMQHGGGTIFYTDDGVLYASGVPSLIRSTDNGATWQTFGASGAFTAVGGDGDRLYTQSLVRPSSFISALESNDGSWSAYDPHGTGAQMFNKGGSFEFAFDPANDILYSASWDEGLWALKVIRSATDGVPPARPKGLRIR